MNAATDILQEMEHLMKGQNDEMPPLQYCNLCRILYNPCITSWGAEFLHDTSLIGGIQHATLLLTV